VNIAETVRGIFQDSPVPRSVLIAGSGPDKMPEWEKEFTVTYLDIEPRNNPDIVADMCQLPEDIGPYDAVFCCHALEHLYPHQVPWALMEFRRVLKASGVVVVMVPDLEDVKPTEEVLAYPEAGAICGLHLFYGDARQIQEFPHMAHHSGFVKETLKKALEIAGFHKCESQRLGQYNLLDLE
jgi:predicted SAM-dependent methyltransferase